MKKILITLVAIFFSVVTYSQQIAENAIGLRLGDNDGFGTEISYQRALGGNNRLEADLGWRSHDYVDAFRLTGLYQWVWNLDGGFNWYAGAGAGVGSVSYDDEHFGHDDNDDFFALLAGDIGLEYNFDFPLLLSLDFRPEFGLNDYNDDLSFDIALGVRYQF